jgi:hypothetical protein
MILVLAHKMLSKIDTFLGDDGRQAGKLDDLSVIVFGAPF